MRVDGFDKGPWYNVILDDGEGVNGVNHMHLRVHRVGCRALEVRRYLNECGSRIAYVLHLRHALSPFHMLVLDSQYFRLRFDSRCRVASIGQRMSFAAHTRLELLHWRWEPRHDCSRNVLQRHSIHRYVYIETARSAMQHVSPDGHRANSCR